MKTAGLITSSYAEMHPEEVENIKKQLIKYGFEIVENEDTDKLFSEIDMAIVLGGDGTILSLAEYSAEYNVPLLGLNFGHLGYLAELKKDQIEELSKIAEGDYKIEERIMLSVEVIRDGKQVYHAHALNDVVATKGLVSKMVHILLEIDGKYTGDYYSDGIIVSTPTGSTAYSLSAGGPIVEPKLNIMVVTPICAHSTNARPMVISDEQTIKLMIDIYHGEDVALMCDGKEPLMLCHGDEIYVTKSKYKTKLIRLNESNFFDILNKKLKRGN